MNRNVGRSSAANNGLILQAKPKITTSDAGLKETTLVFHLRDDKAATIQPSRKTKVTDFVSGSLRTTALLAALDYLGAQSSDFTPGGFCVGKDGLPGIGILQVLCQGAIFDTGFSAAPVVAVPIVNRGDGYTSPPLLSFAGGDELTPAVAITRLQQATVAFPGGGGSGYDVGDILTLSGGTFTRPMKQRVIEVGGGGDIVNVVTVDRGSYSVVPANPVSFTTDGGGSGASFQITWRLDAVIIIAGGSYGGTPVASVTGLAILGTVEMGTRHLLAGTAITTPFDPVTTVKDTVEVPIYGQQANPGSPPPVPSPDFTTQARACASSLDYDTITVPNVIGNYNHTGGAMPPVDGVSLNFGDRFILNDGTVYAGIYKVMSVGGPGLTWYATRVHDMDESSEVNTTVKVLVAEGSSNQGIWNCTVTGAFTINVNPITFVKQDEPAIPTPINTVVSIFYKVTIDYEAIELNFEYVAAKFVPRPRFLRNEYPLSDNGELIIDPITGRKMALQIDSVSAIEERVMTDGSIVEGGVVAIDEAVWRSGVKYVGTASQFEQTPAGAAYHVKETTTIKIVSILAPGTIVPPGPES